MSILYKELLKEEKELENIVEQTKNALVKAPEGKLRIKDGGKKPQYYYKTKENSIKYPQGKYLKQSEKEIAKAVAQRDYDEKLLYVAEKQLKHLKKLLYQYKDNNLQAIYKELNEYRQELVNPRIITDEQYLDEWLKREYCTKEFAEDRVRILTNRGERVRSKSEKIIADTLDRYDIPYHYEEALMLKHFGKVYPDFTILNVYKRKEIYWEHLGMMDNAEYSEKALLKIEAYQKSGYYLGKQLIITYESMMHPLETEMIERNIIEYCIS